MAAKQAESSLTPRPRCRPSRAFALLAICFAGLVVVACGDSQSPTAPDPTSSSSSSTVGSTSSSTAGSTTSSSTTVPTSTTSSSTTSVNNTRICDDELGTLSSGTHSWRNVVLQDYCVSPTRGLPALFSHFRLAQASNVTIDMASSEFDTFLTLRSGRRTSGSYLHQNDDSPGLGRNSRIVAFLEAGEYTIEQGTFDAFGRSSAAFSRTISVTLRGSTSTSSTTTSSTSTSSTTTVPRTSTTSSTTTSSTTTVPRTTTSVQNLVVEWTLEDACYDGRQIEYRFFLYNSRRGSDAVGAPVGQWPGGDQVYLLSDEEVQTHRLRLDRSEQAVCWGAQIRGDDRSRYWGRGIYGRESCNNCCGIAGVRYRPVRLLCQ